MRRKPKQDPFTTLNGLAGTAFSAFGEIKDEIEAIVKMKISAILSEMDLVRRDEVEVLRDMIAHDRARIKKLEQQLGNTTATTPAPPTASDTE